MNNIIHNAITFNIQRDAVFSKLVHIKLIVVLLCLFFQFTRIPKHTFFTDILIAELLDHLQESLRCEEKPCEEGIPADRSIFPSRDILFDLRPFCNFLHRMAIILISLQVTIVLDQVKQTTPRDFVMDTSMSGTFAPRKEENGSTSNPLSTMNITPPNIPNIADENLNRL